MRIAFVVTALLICGCTLDTELPRPPPIGAVTGTLVLTDGVSSGAREVQLFTAQGQRFVTTTGDDGRFTFGELQPGAYTVVFRLRPFEQLVVPGVRVVAGETTDVGELRPASLKGTPLEGTINGVVSAMGGGSVFGATVDVLLPPANDKVASVTIGANGLFSIRVPPATYLLRGSHPNYVTTELADVIVMEAAVTDLASTPIVLAINPATLNGTVLKERDGLSPVPASGVIVTLDTGATTSTDVDGKFTITGIPAGVRAVRFALTSYVDPVSTRTIDLRAGQGATLPNALLLLARGQVSGVVELTDRAPLDVAAVSLTGTSMDAGVAGISGYGAVVSPDPSQPWRGTYTIANVPFGTYELAASRQRYSRATTVVTIAEVPAQASVLQLTPQLGEFEIDDQDPESSLGFTRRTRVQLNFTRFPTSGIADYRVSDDPNFTDAGFVPYVGPQVSFDLAPADGGVDGVKVIYAQYRQTGGATSPTFQNSIVLDRVPPSRPSVDLAFTGSIGQASSLRKFTTNNQVLPLTVTGTDDRAGLSGMRLSGVNTVDAQGALQAPRAAYQASSTFTRTVTGDGEQRVHVQLVDNAGNVSALGEDVVFIDTQAPSGSITVPRGLRATVNGFTHQPQVEVTPVTGVEPNGGVVQVKLGNATGAELDGAPFSVVRPNIPWTLGFGADGPRTVFAVFRDSAGNTSMPVNTSITLDTAPPSPVSASLVQTSPTNQLNVQVLVGSSAIDLSPTQAITVSDDPGFTSAGTVGPAALPATGMVGYALAPGDGLRTLYVRFRDGAGNDSITPVSFTLDRDAPTGTLSIIGALADGTPSTTLTATSSVTIDARVSGATRYRLGDASMTTCSTVDADYTPMPANGQLPFTLTGSGATRTVRGCFRDAAGNTLGGGAPFQPSATIAFDAVAPTGCVLSVVGARADGSPAPAGRAARLDVEAQLTGCSGATEVAFAVGPLTCATARYERPDPARLSLPPGDGMKTISACARDDARNSVAVPSFAITLDTTPPSNTSIVLENGDGFVNAADLLRGQNMGLRRAIAEATFTDATEVTFVFRRPAMPSVTRMLGVSPVSFTIDLTEGLNDVRWTFADDLGNRTTEDGTGITVDTVAPTAPVLTVVDMGNRSARLFWDLVNDAQAYQLVTVGTPDVISVVGKPTSGAGEGVVLGLVNRREYTFVVRAIDAAGNVSASSNSMTATTGWRRVSVPLSTTYPVKPLDIALRGNEVFLTFSERDAEWLAETGNLRMAYSPDLGLTWTFSTIDGAFGWDRRVAHLTVTPARLTVASVGTDQDPAAISGATIGELKTWVSTDGLAWTNVGGGALTNASNFVDTSGASSIINGSIGRFYGVRSEGSSNVIQVWTAAIGTGFFFGLPSLTTYYDAPDSVRMRDFRTCSGNFAVTHAWREDSRVMALSHRFFGDSDFTIGQEGTVDAVASPGATVHALDLACAAQSGSTNAYVVYRTGNTLGLRRKLGSASWAGTGSTMPVDADPNSAPSIAAAGNKVMVVYRTQTGQVRIGESADEGTAMVFRRVEADPQQGRSVVIGGDTVSSDLALAWTDAENSSLTVLVPALRAIPGRALPGIDTATLAWSASGQSKFRIDRSNDLGLPATFTDSLFTTQPSFEVNVPATGPVLMHQLSGVDAFNQGSNDGEIWQVAPFQASTLIAAPVAPGVGNSTTAAIVAHDDAVMVLPPANFRPTGASDLTVYTSSNAGETMTPLHPVPAVTSTRRSLSGGAGRAVLAYRVAGAPNQVRARVFSTLTPASFPAEQTVDNSNVDALATGADTAGNVVVVTANVSTDQLTFAWNDAVTGAFTVQPRLTVPNPGTDTIRDVAVWKVSPARVVIAWRQFATTANPPAGSTLERVYYVEATRISAAPITYSYGTPVLIHDGSTATNGNQRVMPTSIVSGGANDAYSVLGHVTKDNVVNPSTVNNLMVSVTGTEHPNTEVNLMYLTLDQQPAIADSFSVRADDRGVFALYQVNRLEPSPTETQLKMAVCYSECHLLQSWSRRVLATVPISGNGQMAPVLGLSTTSGNPPYRVYALYKSNGTLQFLRGASLRRIR